MDLQDLARRCHANSAHWFPTNHTSQRAAITHCTLGLAGEAGEVADEIKKILGHGKPIDKAKILNEVGDVLFYADRVLAAFGATMSECMEANFSKLSTRYPTGFDSAERKFGFTVEEGA